MTRIPHQAILAGLASAMLFASVLYVPVLGLMLMQASVIPIMVSGLRFGAVGALVAGLAAGAATLIVLPSAMLPTYACLQLLPALVVALLAMRPVPGLGRPLTPQDGPDAWYPPGHILAWLSASGVPFLILFALGLPAYAAAILPSDSGLHEDGALRDLVTEVMAAMISEFSASADPTVQAELLKSIPANVPGTFLAYWLTLVAVGGVVAQWWAARRGVARRPTPNYRTLALPGWQPVLFLVLGVAGVVLPGDVGYLAANAAIMLSVPLVFLGLVLVHAAARTLPQPKMALVGFYILFILGSSVSLIALTVAGFVEFAIKRRIVVPGPPRSGGA
ncbi:hypothetical protein [Rhodospirillum sp. A1_3_36]|uniref:hypothetical protein n=1 Tax=Rhodospirillum sp. A1_3_36 TaxID=3391666 RepID=UPI0039A6F8D0